ncbi:MAG: acyltransferase [Hydrogenophilales bacterium]|nr:acyltransferase [Hydrogenophilales bacterium]
MNIRLLSLIAVVLLPWAIRRRIYSGLFGYTIHPTARIGFSLVDADYVEMLAGSYIGSLTIIRNLEELSLGEDAGIGTFNWIFGYRSKFKKHFKQHPDRKSALRLGDHAAIVARHIVDCTDVIDIGEYSTIAGHRSQMLTHAIDFRENRQTCAPIRIGRYCFIGTGAILLKGAVIPDYCLIGAGSVVHKPLDEEAWVYAGVPAAKIKPVNKSLGYFIRKRGSVT